MTRNNSVDWLHTIARIIAETFVDDKASKIQRKTRSVSNQEKHCIKITQYLTYRNNIQESAGVQSPK